MEVSKVIRKNLYVKKYWLSEMQLRNVAQAQDSKEFLEYYEAFLDYLDLQIFLDFQLKQR